MILLGGTRNGQRDRRVPFRLEFNSLGKRNEKS